VVRSSSLPYRPPGLRPSSAPADARVAVPRAIGRQVGPFRLEREIGAGAMARIYRATLSRPAFGLAQGEHVAVKVPRRSVIERPEGVARLLREAEAGRLVRHENVVRTHGALIISTARLRVPLLVYEMLEGETLRERMALETRPPERLCRDVAVGVGSALAAVERAGFVHRDVKPENVFLLADGRVKLIDFGLVLGGASDARVSQSGEFIGSLLYAAPEQFRPGPAPIDIGVDLHALGLVLYEMLAGAHPFGDERTDCRTLIQRITTEAPRPLARLRPDVAPAFLAAIARLLEKDPLARFRTPADFLRALAEPASAQE